ncbi:MAG: STAS domain-containing protein [Bacteroidetes bacterium]|nr:STAS domain-containing protein [Bacteroidota bacterium]
MSLIAKETQNGAVTIIHLNGDVLGGPDAAQLNDRLHQLVSSGNLKVVLDLAGVSFMNSSGLGMLIGGLTTMKNAGGSLKLANPAERIQSLLVITKLSTLFSTYKSVEEAIESFT